MRACSLLALLMVVTPHLYAQSGPCAVPDQLRAAGLLAEAEAAYVELLSAAPGEACARDGLNGVAATLQSARLALERARILESRGDRTAAFTAYGEVLDLYPRHDEALTAVARLMATVDRADPFDPVRRLADQGLYTAATERLVKVLDAHPGEAIPDDLTYLTEDGILIFPPAELIWRRYIAPAGVIVAAAAGAVLLLVGVGRWLGGWRVRHVDVHPLGKGPKDLEIGAGVAALIEEKMLPQARRARLDLVEGELPYLVIPDEVRKVMPASWVIDLLAWLLPQHVVDVKGHLLSAGAHGPGVSLTLVDSRNSGVLNSVSLWDGALHPGAASAQEPPAEPYYRLSDRAADWLVVNLILSDRP